MVQVDGARMQRAGSLFWFVPDGGDTVIRSNRQIPESMGRLYPDIFHALLERGIYLPPSPYEVGFLSTAHTAKDIEQLAVAMSAVMQR